MPTIALEAEGGKTVLRRQDAPPIFLKTSSSRFRCRVPELCSFVTLSSPPVPLNLISDLPSCCRLAGEERSSLDQAVFNHLRTRTFQKSAEYQKVLPKRKQSPDSSNKFEVGDLVRLKEGRKGSSIPIETDFSSCEVQSQLCLGHWQDNRLGFIVQVLYDFHDFLGCNVPIVRVASVER
eukprot:351360-Hanusia_phi.AAC.1